MRRTRFNQIRWFILGAGLLFLVVAVIVLFSPEQMVEVPSGIRPPTESGEPPVMPLANEAVPVQLYYPVNWESLEVAEGVTVWPQGEGAEFVKRGAYFAVYSDSEGAEVPPLPALVQEAIAATQPERTAENVAVGGVSGNEIVRELDVSTSTSSSMPDANLSAALEDANTTRLTVVLWEGQSADQHYWVVMADARAGEHLATLELIRNTIEWK